MDEELQQMLDNAIEQVLSEEFPLDNYLAQAEDLLSRGRNLQPQVQQLTAPKKLLEKAAKSASKEFQLNELKAKVKKVFLSGLNDIDGVNADHSSAEDDEFIAKLKKVLEEGDKTIDDLVNYLKTFLEKNKYNQLQQRADSLANSNVNLYADIARFMQDGYRFLGTLGEEIRGSTVVYEVVLNAESESMQKSGYFSIDEILQYSYIEEHRGTFSLRLDPSLIGKSDKLFKWNPEAQNIFKKMATLAHTSEDLSKMNYGQLSEAFRAGAEAIFKNGLKEALGQDTDELLMADPHGIHYYLHTAYTGRLSYMKGPDFMTNIDSMFQIFEEEEQEAAKQTLLELNATSADGVVNIQEKSGRATFTTFNGVLSNVQKAKTSLEKLHNAKSQIQGKTKGATAGIEQRIINLAEKLVQQFVGV